jgi:hypothetical protein
MQLRTLRDNAITASILLTETIYKRFSSLVRSLLGIRIDRDRAQLSALFKEDSVRRSGSETLDVVAEGQAKKCSYSVEKLVNGF